MAQQFFDLSISDLRAEAKEGHDADGRVVQFSKITWVLTNNGDEIPGGSLLQIVAATSATTQREVTEEHPITGSRPPGPHDQGTALQLDPGDHQIQVFILDSGGSVPLAESDPLPHTIRGQATTLEAASVPEPRDHIGLAVDSMEHVGGWTYRVHYQLHNGTHHPIPAGVIVSVSATATNGDAGGQQYEYHEAVPAGATVPRFLTLELVVGEGAPREFSVVVSLLEPSFEVAVQSAPFAATVTG